MRALIAAHSGPPLASPPRGTGCNAPSLAARFSTRHAATVTAAAGNGKTIQAALAEQAVEAVAACDGQDRAAAVGQEAWKIEAAELKELLLQQGRLIAQQQETIKRLEGTVGHLLSAAGGQAALDSQAFHTKSYAVPPDLRLLPRRIVLVRHAQSKGNVDPFQYTFVPDPNVPLTMTGWQQAMAAGEQLKSVLEADGEPYRLFFYVSPYLRCKQTFEGIVEAFDRSAVVSVQEEVQLREQDFGNFQDAEGKQREKAERLRYGRFFYRFPHGESGADVFDRMTIFEDGLINDINAGRFGQDSTLVLVTHGLAARIFLMRWFHWSVEEFMAVWNPPNAKPMIMERTVTDLEMRQGGPTSWVHTKALYRLTPETLEGLVGCTEEMCSSSWLPRSSRPWACTIANSH